MKKFISVTFPNSNREYTYSLPRHYKVKVGDHVIVKPRGELIAVEVVKISETNPSRFPTSDIKDISGLITLI